MTTIIVLDDGETFTNADGCFAVEIPDHWGTQEIERALSNESVICSDVWENKDKTQGLNYGEFSPAAIKRVEDE